MYYPMRPLTCRFFGFSAVLDKHERPQLFTCPVIKKMYHEKYVETVRSLATLDVPIMKNYSMMLYSIDFSLAQRQYPFNDALRMALETVLSDFLYRQ